MLGLVCAVLLGAFFVAPANAQTPEELQTQAVWEAHLANFDSGDIDALLNDFADDAVIMARGGTYRGKDEVRVFASTFFASFTPEIAETFVVDSVAYAGNVVFFNYTIGAIGRSGTDVAIVRDGKLAVIVTLDYPTEPQP
jgi:ketosteroid isomerase-like protein